MKVIRCLLIASSLLLDTAAGSSLIIGVSGTPDTGPSLGGENGYGQVVTTGWSSTAAFEDVLVTALVQGNYNFYIDPKPSVTAYLTTEVGPGATSADLLASTTVTLGSSMETVTLFSGLFVPAGTYYLTMTGPPDTTQSWRATSGGTVSTASGVTYLDYGFANTYLSGGASGVPDSAFPPASTFVARTWPNPIFTVTGTQVSAVPEPIPIWLSPVVLAATIALSLRLRRNSL